MQRQLTDLLQEGAWHGILLCVLVVLFLFFPYLRPFRRRRRELCLFYHDDAPPSMHILHTFDKN